MNSKTSQKGANMLTFHLSFLVVQSSKLMICIKKENHFRCIAAVKILFATPWYQTSSVSLKLSWSAPRRYDNPNQTRNSFSEVSPYWVFLLLSGIIWVKPKADKNDMILGLVQFTILSRILSDIITFHSDHPVVDARAPAA